MLGSTRAARLLDREAPPADYAEAMFELLSDRDRYSAAAIAARAEHVDRLAWDVASDRVLALLAGLVDARATSPPSGSRPA